MSEITTPRPVGSFVFHYFIFKDNVSMLYAELDNITDSVAEDWTKNIV